MKTIEELFREIVASKELQKELKSIGKGQYSEIEALLKKYDCDATAEEFISYVKSISEGEIGDDEASLTAGGKDTILFPEDLPPLPPYVLEELERWKWL